MKRVSQAAIEQALHDVGLQSGSAVFVHSNLIRFGMPERGVTTYFDAFNRILTASGTLAVPTFTFSFIHQHIYHCNQTPSVSMGAFVEFVRKHPRAYRTRHPIQSIAVMGTHAKNLASIETLSAYGAGGVFEAMCDLDFDILVFGAEPEHISHSHLCEERAQVSYRFNKIVSGKTVLAPDEAEINKEWLFFARHLHLPSPQGERLIVADLIARGQWRTASLNGVTLYCGSATSFVNHLASKLSEDPLWMIPYGDKVHMPKVGRL